MCRLKCKRTIRKGKTHEARSQTVVLEAERAYIAPPFKCALEDCLQPLTNQIAQATRLQEDVIIWGDSITSHANGISTRSPCCADVKRACRSAFAAQGISPVLLGIPGDLSSTLLWRLQNGEWPEVAPRIALLLIGTNDLGAVSVRSQGVVKFTYTRMTASVFARVAMISTADSSICARRAICECIAPRV